MNAQSLSDKLKDLSLGLATRRYGRTKVIEKLDSLAEELRSSPRSTDRFLNLGSDPESVDELAEILAEAKQMWASLIDVARMVPGAAHIVEPRRELPPIIEHVFGMAARSIPDRKPVPEARTIRWRPHTETPATDEPITALLAARDEEADGEFFLLGIKLWRKGQWIDEQHFRPVRDLEFWWCPEEEICRELKRMLRFRAFKARQAKARRG